MWRLGWEVNIANRSAACSGPSSRRRATISEESPCSSLLSFDVDDVVVDHGRRRSSNPPAPHKDPLPPAATTKPNNICSLPSHLLLIQKREPEVERNHEEPAMNNGPSSNDSMCPGKRGDDEIEMMSLIAEIMRLERSTNAALRASRDEIQVLRDAANERRAAITRMEGILDGSAEPRQPEVGRTGNFMGRLGWVGSNANGSAARSVCLIHSSIGSNRNRQQKHHLLLSPRAPSSKRQATVSRDSSFSSLSLMGVDVDDVVIGHGLWRTSDPTGPWFQQRWSTPAPSEDLIPPAATMKSKLNTSRCDDDDRLVGESSSSGREGRNDGGGGGLRRSKTFFELMNLGNGVDHRHRKDGTFKNSKSFIGLTNLGNGIGHRHSKDDTPGKNDDDDDDDDKERDRHLGDDNNFDDEIRRGLEKRENEGSDPTPLTDTTTSMNSAPKNGLIAQMMKIHLAPQNDKNKRNAELKSLRDTNATRLSDLMSMLSTLRARSRSGSAQHESAIQGLQLRKKMLTEDIETRRELVTESERRLNEIEGRLEILEKEIDIKTGHRCDLSRTLGGRDCDVRGPSNIARLEREILLCRLRLRVHFQYTAKALQSVSTVIEVAKKNDTDGILFRKQDNLKHNAKDLLGGDKDEQEQRRQYLVEGIALDVNILLSDLKRMIKEIDAKIKDCKFLSSDEMGSIEMNSATPSLTPSLMSSTNSAIIPLVDHP
ncbi:hypothetical protein ACHAXA_007036 [Cyclostephanos tholiformis]|uniref:Uncharacterized protein n=1 Tax=Cyclostephanos tholiformis TaxID=382380 RepID=A0ABD3RBR4_9STRA